MRIYKAAFVANLRQAIEDSGKTQAAIAAAAEVTESMISDYMKGRFTPRPITIIKLAKALNVEALWLSGEVELTPILKNTDLPKNINRQLLIHLLDGFAESLTSLLEIDKKLVDDYIILLVAISRLKYEGLVKTTEYAKDLNKIPEYSISFVDGEISKEN